MDNKDTMEQTPTVDQLPGILNTVTEAQFVKASALASVVVQTAALSEGFAVSPTNVSEWLALYTKHVWTYVAVFAVANTIAKLKIDLWKRNKKTGAIEKVEAHSILDLLEQPNIQMTRYDLMESLATYLELAGNAYWEVVYRTVKMTNNDKTISRVREPKELFNIRPDRLNPVPDKNGKGIKEYVFQTKRSAKKTTMKADQIVRFEYFNPIQDWHGLGAIMPAVDEVMQDIHMTKWNKEFFSEGVMPQGVISTDQVLPRHDQKDIAEQLKQFLVGKGRKIMLLGRNLKWTQVSIGPKDLDFQAGRKENKRAVLASEGVPPVLAGDMDNAKYDNYGLQVTSFHEDTILPKLRKIESALHNNLIPKFPDLVATEEFEYVLLFDTTELMQEDQDRLTNRLVKQFENGWLTPNEARKSLNRDPYPDSQAGGDEFYMKSTMVLVSTIGQDQSLEAFDDNLTKSMGTLEQRVMDALEQMPEQIKKEVLDELG